MRAIILLLTVTLLVGCAGKTPPAATQAPPPPRVTVTTEPAAPPPPTPGLGRVESFAAPSATPGQRVAVPEPPASAPPPAPAPAPPAPRVQTPPVVSPPTTVPVTPPNQRGRNVVLNFDNADIETVIQAASEIVGFNYVLAPDVRGKVTVQTAGRIPQEDVFAVLLAILEVHGFTAVKSGNLYKIIRIEGAKERAVPTIVGVTPDAGRTTDEIITQIVPLRYAPVSDLSTLLRPLISPRGTVAAHRETNVLILTDAASNIRRLLDIVRLVDVEVALEELQIIPVKFADANELAQILNQLFSAGRLRPGGATTTTPAAPAAPAAPGAPPRVPGTTTADSGAAERPPLIVAERRSNSLVVHARKRDLELIKRLLDQLDQNIYSGRRVFVYYAENAKSKELAATLNAIYGGRDTSTTTTTPTGPGTPGTTPRTGTALTPPPPPPPPSGPGGPASLPDAGLVEGQVRFIADETTNAVIVTTYPRNWEEIQETIRQLDRMPRQVLVEVLVAEITLTEDTRLGMDWAIRSGSFRFFQQSITAGEPRISPPSDTLPRPRVDPISLLLPGSGLTALAFSSGEFFAMINALAAESRVNVLSAPHVLTSENKKAVINVSDSIPIITSQQVPFGGTTSANQSAAVVGTQSVEYRDAGVILTVTPRIGERGTVALDVKQEVNDIGPQEPPTGSRRIIKREAETSVVLLNNQTLVLGGLIRDRRSTEDRGVPVMKNIPLIGYLFGAKGHAVQKTELLIFITPRVIGTALDGARVTEEYRQLTPSLEEAIRKAPRQPTPLPQATPPPTLPDPVERR